MGEHTPPTPDEGVPAVVPGELQPVPPAGGEPPQAQPGAAPTLSGLYQGAVISIPPDYIKSLDLVAKSSVRLAAVEFECAGDIAISAKPKFILPDHTNQYLFNLVIGNVKEASICKITAKDVGGQSSSETFQVMPAP